MSARNQFKYLLFLILIAILNQSCTSSKNKEALDKMEWMESRWEKVQDGMKTIEIWHRKSENAYKVNGYMVEGTDTIFAENILIKPGSGTINYVVTIADQNNGKPVVFSLVENTGQKLAFKNPEHDFPQLISYTRLNAGSVLVQLEGVIKGKPVKEKYTLLKR